MRPFRFAAQVSSAPTGKAFRDQAREVESLGYSALHMPDHFGDQWAPIVGLTVAAEATSTLKVGALVWDNDYRHPVVLAKEVATLDLASEGRVEFGLGAGWMRTDYEESGMPYDRPGVRVDRMVEGLAIMKQLWADGKADFTGEHYIVTGAQGLPRPHSSPMPTITIGGGGKRVLTIAAREADIVGFNADLRSGEAGADAAASAVPERFDERVTWVKEAAGDRFDDLELQCLGLFGVVTPDPQPVLEAMAPAFGITPEVAAQIPIVLVGTVDSICETLIERRERWGFSYWVFGADAWRDLAPVVERLGGT